jgi:hypothetical protein
MPGPLETLAPVNRTDRPDPRPATGRFNTISLQDTLVPLAVPVPLRVDFLSFEPFALSFLKLVSTGSWGKLTTQVEGPGLHCLP